MVYTLLALMCVLLVEIIRALKVISTAWEIIAVSKNALGTLSSPLLDDMEKELSARRHFRLILKNTLSFIVKVAIACAILAMFAIACFLMEWVTQKEFFETTSVWSTMVGLTIFTIGYAKIRNVRTV